MNEFEKWYYDHLRQPEADLTILKRLRLAFLAGQAASEQRVKELERSLAMAESHADRWNDIACKEGAKVTKLERERDAANNRYKQVCITRDELIKHLAGQAAERRVPDGWKLVPIEPTEEMRHSAMRALVSDGDWPTTVYRAFLSTTPEPTKESK